MFLNEVKEEIKVEPDFPPSPPPSSAGSTSSLCNTELWSIDVTLSAQGQAKVNHTQVQNRIKFFVLFLVCM